MGGDGRRKIKAVRKIKVVRGEGERRGCNEISHFVPHHLLD